MRICQEYKKKVEERVEKPIRETRVKAQEECRKRKCRKLCLCCNKWLCTLKWVFYVVVEWVVKIVVKWVVYVACRVISSIITLILLILLAVWLFYCQLVTAAGGATELPSDVRLLSTKTLRVEVVIIDSNSEQNPIANGEIDARIADANRILKDRAAIEVRRKSAIRREVSDSLYYLDATGAGGKLSEWLKGFGLLLGRDSPRHMTIYAVRKISGATEGLHQPFFGSVFIEPDTADTQLAHEFGHALLALDKMGHSEDQKNLMYPDASREFASGWPRATPTLTLEQWCSMRKSRWLDFEFACEACPQHEEK
jgi:hypothetical protein